jgi:exosortase
MKEPPPLFRSFRVGGTGIVAGVLVATLVWAYWPTLAELERSWSRDPRYSHGYLVPFFALYLLWLRRGPSSDHRSMRSTGLALFAAGAFLNFFGAYAYINWLSAVSLLLSLAGLTALLGGRGGLRWAWPSIAFLVFMIPLPYRIETALGGPLQGLATSVSTYTLQVLGLPAFRSGNTIVINDYTIGIVDACNGLGASYMVLACAIGAALLIGRPLADKIILVATAIPIALVANSTRITLTGVLHEMIGKGAADTLYHDLAGWLTMPVALVLLFGVYHLLIRIFTVDPDITAPPGQRAAEGIRSEQHDAPVSIRSRILPITVASAVVLCSGLVHGKWTNRWRVSHEIEVAVSKLDQIPMEAGDWQGRTQVVDPREWRGAGLDGLIMRHYANSRTGKETHVVIVCGRPGPVSVHTPEVCYPGAGFEMMGAKPVEFRVDIGSGRANFLRADFENLESFPPQRLRVYWSWTAGGSWGVPAQPRLAFGSRRFLFKLYLVSPTTEGLERSTDATQVEFLRDFLPELQKTLFPPGKSE